MDTSCDTVISGEHTCLMLPRPDPNEILYFWALMVGTVLRRGMGGPNKSCREFNCWGSEEMDVSDFGVLSAFSTTCAVRDAAAD